MEKKNINEVFNETTKTLWTVDKIREITEDVIYILKYNNILCGVIIEIKINSRLTTALGRTSILYPNHFKVEINYNYLKYASDENIKGTIAHEVIHTVPGCWNHKEKFKAIALILRDYGFEIKRTRYDSGYEKFKTDVMKPHYICTCKNCGYNITRQRWSKTLTNMSNPYSKVKYICPKCKKMEWKVEGKDVQLLTIHI